MEAISTVYRVAYRLLSLLIEQPLYVAEDDKL